MTLLQRLQISALGASGALAFALMAGRIAGLVREVVLASRLGISAEADAAIILLTLPDLVVNLLLSGGLSAALVPRLRGLSADDASRLFWDACIWAGLMCSLLAVLIVIWPAAAFGLFAPGISDPVQLAGRDTVSFVALSIPLTALSGVTGALLAARDRYFIAGLGTLIMNLTIIAALLLGGSAQGLGLIGVAILAGAGLRLTSQLLALPHDVWKPTGRQSQIDPAFLKVFAAGITASALALAPPPLIRAAASLLGSGNIATFNYAQKLVELPLGILITTIATVSLTRLSGHFASGENELARLRLWSDLRLALALGLLVVVFGTALAEPLVKLIFLRGAISQEQVSEIVVLTRVILLGVPFVAISSLAAASLNAELRTTEVLSVTGLSLIALAVLSLPGLLLVSERLLMAAVVGSQAVLALLLARRANIWLWGRQGIFSPFFLRAISFSMTIAGISLAVIVSWSQGFPYVILGLSSLAFAISAGLFLIITKH